MTFMFQSLEKTAQPDRQTIVIKHKALQSYDNQQHVPEHKPTVAGKLKECQALGPRLAQLEMKVQNAETKADVEKKFGKRTHEVLDMIQQKKIEDLRIKQQLATQVRKEKELSKLKFYLKEEEKKDMIAQQRDEHVGKLEQHKENRVTQLIDRQAAVKDYHEKERQKLADIKAIQDYKSQKLVLERKQQKEYEEMLHQELHEELVNMKQREKDLKAAILLKKPTRQDSKLNDSLNMSTTLQVDQIDPTMMTAEEEAILQFESTRNQKSNSRELLRQVIIQNSLK